MISITMLGLLLVSSLASAQSPVAACSRDSLIRTRDAFFSKGQPKLAPGAKIALNNKLVQDLGAIPHSSLTGFTEFKVQAVDSEACQIATFRVSAKQFISVRLKTDSAGTISEVDFIQAVQGDQ